MQQKKETERLAPVMLFLFQSAVHSLRGADFPHSHICGLMVLAQSLRHPGKLGGVGGCLSLLWVAIIKYPMVGSA